MTILRRFLVIQALMLWQGGFLFYSAVVVPTGTEIHGAFAQGRITRVVTDTMNAIGAITIAILACDQFCCGSFRRIRWGLWAILAIGVAMLFALHPRIESYVNFSASGQVVDYPAFYFWHRVYLYIASTQWFIGLAYVAITLRAWSSKSPKRVVENS